MKPYKSNYEMNLSIDKIANHSNSVQGTIQKTALRVFLSVQKNGLDWQAINRLYSTLNGGVNKKALRTWIVDHTPLVWNDKETVFKRKVKGKWSDMRWNEMSSVSFWDYHRQQNKNKGDYDADKKIKGLEDRLVKLADEFREHHIDAQLIEETKAFIKKRRIELEAQYKAESKAKAEQTEAEFDALEQELESELESNVIELIPMKGGEMVPYFKCSNDGDNESTLVHASASESDLMDAFDHVVKSEQLIPAFRCYQVAA